MASPMAPLSQLRPNLPSAFICPIVGSMALRRLIIARNARVTPPLLTRHPDLDAGNFHALKTTIDERLLRFRLAQDFGLRQSFAQGVPVSGIERAPTTRPSFSVVTSDTLTPNSYGVPAFPLAMHSTSGACNA
ncbi:MAG: hypothetical protein JWM42_67 [Burkholderia sp.]|nr:hypothetical protein [Burkholderia sp.]